MRRVLKKSGHLGKTNGNLIETHGMDAVETPLLVEKFCAPKRIVKSVRGVFSLLGCAAGGHLVKNCPGDYRFNKQRPRHDPHPPSPGLIEIVAHRWWLQAERGHFPKGIAL